MISAFVVPDYHQVLLVGALVTTIAIVIDFFKSLFGFGRSSRRHGNWWKRNRSSDFYYSQEWDQLRRAVLRKYGCECMKCGERDTVMHVDHIKPRSKYPELELSFDNLQVLCKECNTLKSNTDETDYRFGRNFRLNYNRSRKRENFRDRFGERFNRRR